MPPLNKRKEDFGSALFSVLRSSRAIGYIHRLKKEACFSRKILFCCSDFFISHPCLCVFCFFLEVVRNWARMGRSGGEGGSLWKGLLFWRKTGSPPSSSASSQSIRRQINASAVANPAHPPHASSSPSLVRSLIPARRRLRLDPRRKLYFPSQSLFLKKIQFTLFNTPICFFQKNILIIMLVYIFCIAWKEKNIFLIVDYCFFLLSYFYFILLQFTSFSTSNAFFANKKKHHAVFIIWIALYYYSLLLHRFFDLIELPVNVRLN